MKKIIFSLALLVGLGASNMAFSSNADLFSYDKATIDNEFEEINKLESFVESNGMISYSELSTQENPGEFQLNWNQYNADASPMFGIADMDWGAFAWGFCCWPVGLFTVLFNSNKDSYSKTSYLIGVLTTAVLGAIGGIGAGSTP